MKVLAFGIPPTIPALMSATSSSSPPLFVYGSLCHPKVIDTLLGRKVLEGSGSVDSTTTTTTTQDHPPDGGWVQLQDGWTRHCVRNQLFPALCPVSSSSSSIIAKGENNKGKNNNNNNRSPAPVWGRLFCHLSPREMSLLDWYEGDEYQLQTISVLVPNQSLPFSFLPPHDLPEGLGWTTQTAQVYAWKPAFYDRIEWDKEWSYEHYFCENVETYLDKTVYPCRDELERMDDFRYLR